MSNRIIEQKWYIKAAKLCSNRELCSWDMKQKMCRWGVAIEAIDTIINVLVREGYIDDYRYAERYVEDKFRINQWGKTKIEFHLKLKRIPNHFIHDLLRKIDDNDYEIVAKKIAEQKVLMLQKREANDIRNKVCRYLLSKGYESEIVSRIMKSCF